MSILITGTSGLIGKYLLKYLSNKNYYIIPSCRNPKDSDTLKLDINNREDFYTLPKSIDTVIHLAALLPTNTLTQSTKEMVETNSLGTNTLLNWCVYRGIKKVIFTSTGMVYGPARYLPIDEDHPKLPRGPKSSYGLSKLLGELFCLRFQEDFKMNCTLLRLSEVYGFGSRSGYILSKFIGLAEEGNPLVIYGEGTTERDLLYLKDLGPLLETLLNSNYSGVYNIGSGTGTSIKFLAESLVEIYTKGSTIEYERNIKEATSSIILNIQKARRDLNFNPQYSLLEGLRDLKSDKENSIETH